ncbi:MAG TPA: zf-HC2 domain-containing protein [Terriglobales bacterium]|nr:zf-HC2 domain-containing protein [Terriglobales bacterium]
MQHAEFEALMTDALDGVLAGEAQQRFEGHRAECPACALMYSDAAAGMNWLATLEPAQPPANIVGKIMVATVGQVSAAAKVQESRAWLQKLRAAAAPLLQPVLQPRFALSFAMAFFSISTALSLGGVKLTNVNAASLAPATLANNAIRTFHETTARAAHYYDNLRFVYELESRYRELKNSLPDTNESSPQRQPEQKQNQNQNRNNSSGDPRHSPDHQQYSRDLRNTVVASNQASSSRFARPDANRAAEPFQIAKLEPQDSKLGSISRSIG